MARVRSLDVRLPALSDVAPVGLHAVKGVQYKTRLDTQKAFHIHHTRGKYKQVYKQMYIRMTHSLYIYISPDRPV